MATGIEAVIRVGAEQAVLPISRVGETGASPSVLLPHLSMPRPADSLPHLSRVSCCHGRLARRRAGSRVWRMGRARHRHQRGGARHQLRLPQEHRGLHPPHRPHRHTHTHTHAHTHAHIHTRTHARTHTHARARAHTHTHTHALAGPGRWTAASASACEGGGGGSLTSRRRGTVCRSRR